MDREELYINLSALRAEKPVVSPKIYDIKAMPFLVESFALRAGEGKALGVLAVYMLVEVPAALVVLAVGLPSPWRQGFADRSSYQTVALRKDCQQDGEEDDTVFTWECACFEGADHDLPVSEFYGFVPYDGTTFEVSHCLGQESKVLDNWAYVKLQIEVDGQVEARELNMHPLIDFCDEYSDFLARNLIPRELAHIPLIQLIEQRFALQDVLEDRSSAFSNEIFVDFSVIEQRFRAASIARKNIFYPGKFISCSLTGDVAARIGTFRQHCKKHVSMNCVSYKCRFLHIDDGHVALIEWAKACLPYKNAQEAISKLLMFVYSYNTADSTAATAQARENYNRCSVEVMLRHFTFLYRAFRVSMSEGETQTHPESAELKLFRPVICNVYGGVLLSLSLSRNDVCITIPRFLKVKRPEIKFPIHKSGTVYISVMQITVFSKQPSPFAVREVVKTREITSREIRSFEHQNIQFCVENYGFATYKCQDRLANTTTTIELLDIAILSLIMNRQEQVLFKEAFQPFSAPLDANGPAHTVVANKMSAGAFSSPAFPAEFPSKGTFRAHFESCANMYDCCLLAFLRNIDQQANLELIRYFMTYKRDLPTINYFNLSKGLDDAKILETLRIIGIDGVTEDSQDIELPC